MVDLFDDAEQQKLAAALNELLDMEAAIRKDMTKYTTFTEAEMAGIRDKVKKWLAKALEIAREFRPKEFNVSIGVGLLPEVRISFTWPISSAAGERDTQ